MNETPQAALPPWPYPQWFTHRGGGLLAPENTLAAFRAGAAHGWRAFECDVKLSSDGVPFLLHDATLERTTNGHGIAGERPWRELSALDAGSWLGAAHASETLLSLAAAAQFCIDRQFALNLEIKPTPGCGTDTGRQVAEHAARLWAGQNPPPLLSSFSVEALSAAQAAAPQLPRALLLDKLREGWFDTALRLDCCAVVTEHTLMNAALVERLHAAGLRAGVYTVDDAAEARRLLDAGVDFMISNAVDRLGPAATSGFSYGNQR